MDDLLGFAHPGQRAAQMTIVAGSLALAGITRRFGEQVAVNDVSLEIRAGELLALVGASGSGKTTTLRIAAGHEHPDAGSVLLDGRDITRLPPQGRGFGMVFQHYALFPHMSVADNVAFGLEARGAGKAERRSRAVGALAAVGLEHAAGRQVQSLSGGEQQRVAVARALVIEPRVLLLDEPLSNLDPTLRRGMREDLRAILRDQHVTALFVTHDQDDAFAIADRVALMRLGKLLQVGSPETLYRTPASREVAEFIGRSTLVKARLEGDGRSAVITLGGVSQRVTAAHAPGASHTKSPLAVLRPEALALAGDGAGEGWPGRVLSRRFAGVVVHYVVELSDGTRLELTEGEGAAPEGANVRLRIAREPVALVAE